MAFSMGRSRRGVEVFGAPLKRDVSLFDRRRGAFRLDIHRDGYDVARTESTVRGVDKDLSTGSTDRGGRRPWGQGGSAIVDEVEGVWFRYAVTDVRDGFVFHRDL
jgi:hypothetical protein